MLKYAIVIGVAFAMIGAVPDASAQKATEIYIPIGKSPGLSGEYTKMGTIEEVSAQEQAITMSDAAESYTIQELNALSNVLQGVDNPEKRGHRHDLRCVEIDAAAGGARQNLTGRRIVEGVAVIKGDRPLDGLHRVVVEKRATVRRLD